LLTRDWPVPPDFVRPAWATDLDTDQELAATIERSRRRHDEALRTHEERWKAYARYLFLLPEPAAPAEMSPGRNRKTGAPRKTPAK
jgi:hypothetical protein